MDADVIEVCKNKVIEEVWQVLHKMFKGNYDINYLHILALINYIQAFHHLDQKIAIFEKLIEDGIDIQLEL